MPPPAATTVPVPSNPAGAPSSSGTPYRPRMYIMSDGLAGAASMRISTWPGPGRATGSSATVSRALGGASGSSAARTTRACIRSGRVADMENPPGFGVVWHVGQGCLTATVRVQPRVSGVFAAVYQKASFWVPPGNPGQMAGPVKVR